MTNNRRAAAAVLALAFLAAALPAQKADGQTVGLLTANNMVGPCKEATRVAVGRDQNLNTLVEQSICIGIFHELLYVGRALPVDIGWCNPPGVTNRQAMRVVIAYIERRPQRMHEDFRSLAAEALHEAWPCKLNGGPARKPWIKHEACHRATDRCRRCCGPYRLVDASRAHTERGKLTGDKIAALMDPARDQPEWTPPPRLPA